jgi:hypothetical protein
MGHSTKLTKKEKRNGRRKLLIPSKDIQAKMHPISLDMFTGIVQKAIPPPPSPDSAK